MLARWFGACWGDTRLPPAPRSWPSRRTRAAARPISSLPLGTAYTVWTGIGAVGTIALGILLLGEPADFRRLICIGLILAGVVGLKLVSSH